MAGSAGTRKCGNTTMKDYDIYHVGISGGKDSTALLLWAVNHSGFPADKIHASFCDTGNEHQLTYDYIKMLSDKVHFIETITPPLDFYELAIKKMRFPSTKARFCTQQLKIFPTQNHIKQWQKQDLSVLLMSGVRANESEARSKLTEFAYDDYYFCDIYRPLLSWTIDKVWELHNQHGIPKNPLYDYGARRVGCFPCIMSNKLEIRNIAKNFPERIDKIREAEKITGRGKTLSTFFSPSKVPSWFRSLKVITKKGVEVRVPTIDDVVDWSKTGMYKASQYEFDMQEIVSCESNIGMCE